MWATHEIKPGSVRYSISQDFMFPEDCFNKQSGALNCVGDFHMVFMGTG